MALPQELTSYHNEELVEALVRFEHTRLSEENPGGVTKALKKIVEDFNLTVSGVNYVYYSKIKDKFNVDQLAEFVKIYNGEEEKVENISNNDSYVETKQNNDKIDQEDTLQNSLKTPELRPKKPPYKHGEKVPVRVVKVLDKIGAICITTDGYDYQGLVHISQVKNGYVTDIHEHFEEAMEFEAVFKGLNNRMELELSTVGVKLPKVVKIDDYRDKPENNVLADKLSSIKDQIAFTEQPESTPPPFVDKPTVAVTRTLEGEVKDVATYIKGIVGILSPGAQEMLVNTIENHGVFKFTMAMMKVAEGFENDLGKMFIQEVNEKIGERP